MRQPGECPEGAGDADALAGGARGEADAPGEPGGAGGKAIIPAGAGVELANEVEQARGGGVEVSRQLGDLVAQTLQLSARARGSERRGEPINRCGHGG